MRRGATGILCVTVGTLLVSAGAPTAEAASVRACKPIKNPYAGTRYEGTDISRIRSRGASCRGARRVARGAHYKALGLTRPWA